MKKNYSLLAILMIIISLVSCKKQDFNGITDLRPTVPVTVTNAIDFRPEPTVSTSISGGGQIQIALSIPASSGRTIKEITKIVASTSYTAIQTATSASYIAAPIAVGGTTYTYNTTLSEYVAKGPGSIPAVSTTAGTELAKRFYFMITLDDGSVIYPEPVRVLVTN